MHLAGESADVRQQTEVVLAVLAGNPRLRDALRKMVRREQKPPGDATIQSAVAEATFLFIVRERLKEADKALRGKECVRWETVVRVLLTD